MDTLVGISDLNCYPLSQEHIIEKKGRGREREMTTHLIKMPVLTHTSHVMLLLNLARLFKMKAEKLGVLTCTAK